MTVNIGSERRGGSVGIDSARSWRIRPDPDPTRGRESLRVGDESFYWLIQGKNARRIYEDDSRRPFTIELRSRKDQRLFSERLRGVLRLYRDAFQEVNTDTSGDFHKQTILGTYRHAQHGRTAIVVTSIQQIQQIEHIWVSNTDDSTRR